MKITTEYLSQTAIQKNSGQKNVTRSFSDIMDKLSATSKQNTMSRDTFTKTTDYGNLAVYSKEIMGPELKLPMESERYGISDASYIEGVPAYGIVDKLSGKAIYLREDQLVIQKDPKTGMEFMINPDENPIASNVRVTDELKNMIYELAGKRNVEVKETGLQSNLTINRDPKTGLQYLTILGDEGRGASIIINSEKDVELMEKLVCEFQKYSASSQRGTAELYAVLEVSGNLKREDKGFTYLTPNGISYIPYNENDRAWDIDISNNQYSIARKYLAYGINCTKIDTWTGMLPGIKVYLEDETRLNQYKFDKSGRYNIFSK